MLRHSLYCLLVLCTSFLLSEFKPCEGSELSFKELQEETASHVDYLSSIGLADRAQNIDVQPFVYTEIDQSIDLSTFQHRTTLPIEVLDFDPEARNTLITSSPDSLTNDPVELKKILDIRLYPALRKLAKECKVEVFLGTAQEMAAYYTAQGTILQFQFHIPSSATYYLARADDGKMTLIMAGLVSRENMVAQLLTLKLADVNVEAVEIIGELSHFSDLALRDMGRLLQDIPALSQGEQILIVAGCGLEETIVKLIQDDYEMWLELPSSFKGDILSLTHIPLKSPIGTVRGIISLELVYGEIIEELIERLLLECDCSHVFTGGAGAYIPAEDGRARPTIGERVSIRRSMNHHGEYVSLDDDSFPASKVHLQIPSIFMETYSWLELAESKGSSVDVETFYILRAIQNHNNRSPVQAVRADCGYFVLDFVGEEALREYSRVYTNYPACLGNFLENALKPDKRAINKKGDHASDNECRI